MLRAGGALVYYDTEMQPIHVRMGKAEYPTREALEAAAARRQVRLERVLLEDLPDPRMQNVAVIGRLASLDLIPLVTRRHYEDALRGVLKPQALEENLKVFNSAAAKSGVVTQQ
jgi:indolepyruvate ferredoxin oxidoreductase beta subunit